MKGNTMGRDCGRCTKGAECLHRRAKARLQSEAQEEREAKARLDAAFKKLPKNERDAAPEDSLEAGRALLVAVRNRRRRR